MAHEEKLPWELTEEILSRVPPKSLVRFKTICKPWNALFHDKTFINNHKMTFRFILATKSKIYSVSINPEIMVRELTLDTPGLESHEIPKNFIDCNEFLLCEMDKGSVVWNPWLKQTNWIEPELKQTRMVSYGIGQNNKGSYKIVASCTQKEEPTKRLLKIHDFASETWKDHHSEGGASNGPRLHARSGVSLNGNLYWVTYYDMVEPLYQVTKFNSSSEGFFKFCNLPSGTTYVVKDALVLRVFNGDRFSLLKQCHATKKIEISVSSKINNHLNCQGVEWIKVMEVSSPLNNLPDLVDSHPSYFIEDKRVVVCSCDQTGRAWIYVLGENKVISKTRLDSVVDPWPSHCSFTPGLVPVPRGQREELAELQV
ncbi:F-box/kelch-repeat protein [Cardamine amara subsp. amara]|uniref:F-box/kelch-repeat protein n=1 Tax=Cardamine amara subsp. amara TaxID=228776 RepID=A0ABD1C2J6_CARAN